MTPNISLRFITVNLHNTLLSLVLTPLKSLKQQIFAPQPLYNNYTISCPLCLITTLFLVSPYIFSATTLHFFNHALYLSVTRLYFSIIALYFQQLACIFQSSPHIFQRQSYIFSATILHCFRNTLCILNT